MNKVILLSNDQVLNRNIEYIIDKQIYQLQILNININSLYTYCCNFKVDICLVHSSVINGYYQIFDMLIASRKCYVIYFSSKMETGQLYNVIGSSRFNILTEQSYYSINDVIQLMIKDSQIIEKLEEEVSLYKEKVEEERMIRKVKLMLIKKLGLTEDEAYKYILKKSMDERISKFNAAKKIFNEVGK